VEERAPNAAQLDISAKFKLGWLPRCDSFRLDYCVHIYFSNTLQALAVVEKQFSALAMGMQQKLLRNCGSYYLKHAARNIFQDFHCTSSYFYQVSSIKSIINIDF